MYLTKLPVDLLHLIALKLDYEELVKLSQVSPIIKEKVLDNDIFWLTKIKRDLIKYGYADKDMSTLPVTELNEYLGRPAYTPMKIWKKMNSMRIFGPLIS